MKKYLFLIAMMLLLPITVNAANANIDINASPRKASIGTTINVTVNVNSSSPIGYYEYNLDYDHDKLELISGRSYNVESANNSTTKSFKKQFSFKVKKSGANKVSVKSYAVSAASGHESMSVTVNPVRINSSGNEVINASDNNNLSSLKIDKYKIEPSFNKNTTNYVLKIEDDIDEINVIAKPENSKASVTGDGKHKLKTGDNRIEVTVTSENGSDKIYTIKIRLTGANSLTADVDGIKYTIMKKLDSFTNLKNFEIKKIIINDTEVDSLYNSNADITLVGLKDKNGKAVLYIYDVNNKTYSLYYPIVSDSFSILPLSTTEKLDDYSIYKEMINGNQVECYKDSNDSNSCIIYGINLDTGEKDWFVYDLDKKTIKKYDSSLDNTNIDNNEKNNKNNTEILIYILSGTTLLFGIMTIVFAIKSGKKK